MSKFTFMLLCLCSTLTVLPLEAEDSTTPQPRRTPQEESLNNLIALRAKLMIEANSLESDIRKAINDKNLTSPAIEALRKKVEDLQREILKTYSQIRDEIEKLPEIKEKRTAIAEKEKRIEELTKQIDASVK